MNCVFCGVEIVLLNILSRVLVTIEEVRIGDWIYWPLLVQSFVITIIYNNSQKIFFLDCIGLAQFWLDTLSLSTTTITTGFYCPVNNYFSRIPQKTLSSVVQNERLPVCYIAVNIFLLLNACVVRMCLPTRCLAMGTHVTIFRWTEYRICSVISSVP
jgi:hypothetical protein